MKFMSSVRLFRFLLTFSIIWSQLRIYNQIHFHTLLLITHNAFILIAYTVQVLIGLLTIESKKEGKEGWCFPLSYGLILNVYMIYITYVKVESNIFLHDNIPIQPQF